MNKLKITKRVGIGWEKTITSVMVACLRWVSVKGTTGISMTDYYNNLDNEKQATCVLISTPTS